MFMDYFFLKNDPQRVNEPRKVKQQRQHQAYPKRWSQPGMKPYAKWREYDGQNDQ